MALRGLRREVTRVVLVEAGELMQATAPLLADGRLSKKDGEQIIAGVLQARHNISMTGATIAVNLAHETLTKTTTRLDEMRDHDEVGEAAMDAALAD